jgi:ABC-type uncharacterized transport system ATPase subunit
MVNGNQDKSGSTSYPAKPPAANAVVQIQGLSKTYTVNEQEAGAKATIRGIFHRKTISHLVWRPVKSLVFSVRTARAKQQR